ncbi:MAG: hypothetical protein KC636_16590 [Myxococcales bacterium]|nr:hypothetical protein [Myxococcales bacterium]
MSADGPLSEGSALVQLRPAGSRGDPLAPLPHEAFTIPHRFPFQLGLYMAVNAISDAYAIIDGPDCLYRKAEWIHGKHDLCSTLLDAAGQHRIVSTLVNAEAVIKSDGSEVARRIRRLAQLPDVGAAAVCSMPHVTIIGTQYDSVIAELQGAVPFPLFEVPDRSLQRDWIDGYTDTLEAIAGAIDISGRAPGRERVAVIGYVMDRTEEDHRGNVRELQRMLEALGLTLTSVWLSGDRFSRLADACDAGTLIALPRGRRAAEQLSRRTGARVIEAPLPFGLGATRRFLLTVGAAFDRVERARQLIDRELARLIPRLEWVIPHYLVGRRVAFVGDPELFAGLHELAVEVGLQLELLVGSARRREGLAVPDEVQAVLFAPPEATLRRVFADVAGPDGFDLLICDSKARATLTHERGAHLNFGFPCFQRHALYDSPYLGFHGWMWLLSALVEALARSDEQA